MHVIWTLPSFRLRVFSRTIPRTVARLSPVLDSSGRSICRARRGWRSSLARATDPSHPRRTTSKRLSHRAARAGAMRARSHRFVNVDCHGEAVPSSWEKRRPRRGSPLSHVRYQAPQRELTASQAAVSGCHSTQLSSLARGPCRYWHTARRVSEIGGWTVSQLLTSRTSTVGRARVRCSPRT